jgi:hypothetical protein
LKTYYAARKKIVGLEENGGGNAIMRNFAPSREDVETFENALEAEYMPFYIHDLRTHELISMPAFITEFGETFSANYNSVKGVGRQDAVRLYQDTERGVTFGFMLVATDNDSHDILWDTVNRLVSMCYPQYSAGRQRSTKVNDKNVNFIQPFSQVPAASPMVRLRLGDVFKSNYSKFGLARLFGVNSSAIQLNSNSSTLVDDRQKREIEVRKDVKARFDKIKERGRPSEFVGSKVKLRKGATLIRFFPAEGAPESEPAPSEIETTIDNTILANKEQNTFLCVINYNGDKRQIYFDDVIDFSSDTYSNSVASDSDIQQIDQKLKDLKGNDATYSDASFFSSNKETEGGNAIVRSFESTRGRGVAGFITSIGLDYGMGNYPWDIRPGHRAPNVVKISLGFAPVTDLPLGLNYDGEMRNPSHPVGGISGQFGDVYGGVKGSSPNMKPDKNFEETWKQSPGGVIYDDNSSAQSIKDRKKAGPRKDF